RPTAIGRRRPVRGAGKRRPSALARAGAARAEALARGCPHVRGGAGRQPERNDARARWGGAVARWRAGDGGGTVVGRARGRIRGTGEPAEAARAAGVRGNAYEIG